VEFIVLIQIVYRLLQQLITEKQLLVVEKTDMYSLATELVQEMPRAKFGAHFGSWLSSQLLAHHNVVELYASDQDLNEALQGLGAR
jgi:hypothetical protein